MDRFSYFASLTLALLAACSRGADLATRAHADSVAAIAADSVARARQDSINRSNPGYVIDSLLPVEEEIRRFRSGIGGTPVSTLTHASPSRDSLLARFVRAIEQSDTTDLRHMALGSREFIDLYYPESPHTHPPYRQSPAYLWGQLDLNGAQGLARLLEHHGGKPFHMNGVVCDPTPLHQGRNVLWPKCELVVRDGKGEHRERLFGTIIEREGRFKFVSYANQY